jgi:hypothetical protein
LSRWLRSERRSRLPVPWLYVRAKIAAAWGVPPWEVDEAPWSEVALAQELLFVTGEILLAPRVS